MIFISHRVNTLAALRETDVELGAEIDLRDHGDRIILQHDPFSDGEDFEPWLAEYRHRTLILNVKSERVELRVKPLLEKYGITDYFFLDSTVPMIFKLSNEGDPNSAARFSEIEPLESVLALCDPSPSGRTWLSSHLCFKLDGAAATERGMSSDGVVPSVDPI